MDRQGPQSSVTPMTFFLSLVLVAVLSGGGVFVWDRMIAEQARLIFERQIEDLQTQRDLVLGQRLGLQHALEALQEERKTLKGEEEEGGG